MASKNKKPPQITVTTRSNSTDSVNAPRTPRFAEATSVNSPIEPKARPYEQVKVPAKQNTFQAQSQPSDVGFGYINDPHRSMQADPGVEMPATPRSPLKSALKSPGAPPRTIDNPLSPTFKNNPLSPTYKEEHILEKREEQTEKSQAKDLKIKTRVRIAKMILRGTNFACSLIVVAMLASTFMIFNATRNLPPRNGLPAWSPATSMWPQIVLIVIGSVSLFMSIIIFYGYARGGHQRAEKVAVYYTVFAVGFFLFSVVLWCIGLGLLKGNQVKSKGTDMWGWSCKNNNRKLIYQNAVNYDIVCRFMNWTLVCAIIEVIVEVIAIIIYAVVFYRYITKRRLHKTMVNRDRARSDLYLAQLRSQSAPPTPGGPLSPRGAAAEGAYNPMFSPRYAPGSLAAAAAAAKEMPPSASTTEEDDSDAYSIAESGQAESVQYVSAKPGAPKPFTLKSPPPSKSPKLGQARNFSAPAPAVPAAPAAAYVEHQHQHQHQHQPQSPYYQQHQQMQQMQQPQRQRSVSAAAADPAPLRSPAAPGEKIYDAVPIPGAYGSPMQSPTLAPASLRAQRPPQAQAHGYHQARHQGGDYFQPMR